MGTLIEQIEQREREARGKLLAAYRAILLRDLAGEPADGDAKELGKAADKLGLRAADIRRDRDVLKTARDLAAAAADQEAAAVAMREAAAAEILLKKKLDAERVKLSEREAAGWRLTIQATLRHRKASDAAADLKRFRRKHAELLDSCAEIGGDDDEAEQK